MDMIKTIENIRKNPNVSIVVWNKKWEGYQINGTASCYERGEWLKFVKSLKENIGEPCRGAIVVEIKNIKKLA